MKISRADCRSYWSLDRRAAIAASLAAPLAFPSAVFVEAMIAFALNLVLGFQISERTVAFGVMAGLFVGTAISCSACWGVILPAVVCGYISSVPPVSISAGITFAASTMAALVAGLVVYAASAGPLLPILTLSYFAIVPGSVGVAAAFCLIHWLLSRGEND